ncbi:UNVERIFIED_CONTAM: Glucan endo-1,3-beta-glucosidase 5 [Sesamum calycinum]|uniref:Glucan endo-1,3-beta-glucosidase 5 n=1 Tax=Sesamum calycinum TaxID=2727403 RepID=A0AAW2SVJ5_9LAMI
MGRQFPFSSSILLQALTVVTISCCSFNVVVEGVIGVNWGRQTSHRLIPSTVVDLLLQNGIHHLKVFSVSDNVLEAFGGGDIAITVTLPNESLKHIMSIEAAERWLQDRIRRHRFNNINISSVYVGNQPFSTFYHTDTYNNAVDTLKYIQEAIYTNGFENIMATTSHFTDVLKPGIMKPSEADFRPDLKKRMVEFVSILNTSNAPFVMDIFPIHFVAQHKWDMEFCFLDNKSNFSIEDNGHVYTNVFEFVYDSFVVALTKAGAPNVRVMVGQIGWPTDGYPGANVSNAERFFREFIPFVKSTKGTPLRPGISIDAYIHSLVDENRGRISLGAFQRHWGVYLPNGKPKYKIDFSGAHRDMYPTTAKGVVFMPKRWCMFKGDKTNLTKVANQVRRACAEADCTSLLPGGSCSQLTFDQNVSYAFNRYFQMNSQYSTNGSSCNFENLAAVVSEDPSVGTCKFPVEILAAERAETDGLMRRAGGGAGAGKGYMAFLDQQLFCLCFQSSCLE